MLAGLVLAGTLVWLHPALPLPAVSPTPLPAHDPLAVDAYSAGIECVDGAAWSPDGRRVAGAPQDVAAGAPPLTLTLYDCHSGRVS